MAIGTLDKQSLQLGEVGLEFFLVVVD